MYKDMLVFRTPHQEGEQRFTVVGKIVGDNLELAASRCSPNDNFNKKLGRRIAEGRLKKESFVSVEAKENLIEQFLEESILICEHFFGHMKNVKELVKPHAEPMSA
jgi:hypothetical protein